MHNTRLRIVSGWRMMIAISIIVIVASGAFAQQIQIGTPGNIAVLSSTIPSNGDDNPYVIFRVPRSVGKLVRGNILISNFNSSSNLQGTAQRW